jgi:hypothetical protein
VYEFNFGNDADPQGPFTLNYLEIKSDIFKGNGSEDNKYKYQFEGTVKKDKFEIRMRYDDS